MCPHNYVNRQPDKDRTGETNTDRQTDTNKVISLVFKAQLHSLSQGAGED